MKRIEYLIWSALCLILVSCEAPVVDDFGVRLPEEPLAVTGCVVDTDGAPMEGVVVSDGYTVTQTDAEGRYEITAPRCAAFVWVSAPEGYMAPLKESGIPDFFRALGSFETTQTCDFTLERLDDSKPWVMLAVGDPALRTMSLAFVFAGACIIVGGVFQALGNSVYSMIVSIARQLVVLLPVAYLLSLSGNIDAVWFAFPIAEVASLSMTVILFLRLYRKKIRPLSRMPAAE